MEKIKVLIADDHSMFRQGLRSMLEVQEDIDVVGEAADGNVVIQKSNELQVDVILLDLEMPELDGITAARIIKQNRPNIAIIVLTMYEDDRHLFEAIRAGVNGYVLKESSVDILLRQIKIVSEGESVLSSSVAQRITNEFARLAQPQNLSKVKSANKLTCRENEILNLLANKHTNREIARRLFISEKTVKNHFSNIYRKLDCCDRTQAVLKAIRLGLIKIETPT